MYIIKGHKLVQNPRNNSCRVRHIMVRFSVGVRSWRCTVWKNIQAYKVALNAEECYATIEPI
jgi:hypothetical protein